MGPVENSLIELGALQCATLSAFALVPSDFIHRPQVPPWSYLRYLLAQERKRNYSFFSEIIQRKHLAVEKLNG